MLTAPDSGRVILQYGPQWLQFDNPVEVIAVAEVGAVREALARAEEAVNRRGWYAAGFLTYEAAPAFDPAFQVRSASALPLLWFGLYRQVRPVLSPAPGPDDHTLGDLSATASPAAFRRAITHIKQAIAAGETYQVNYTMRLRARFSGQPWSLFARLAQAQQGQYAAYVDTGRFALCSASPELFFSREGEVLTARPMKGTAPRGGTPAEDDRLAAWLHHSPKNRAENVMIVDMIRNDLSRVAELGSVRTPRLFEIERYPTVLQMTSTVTARSRRSLAEIVAALFPCASITGAPKVRTMQIIAKLETEPRGIYTGAIGFMAPSHQAQFNVAIRTVAIDRQTGLAEYGVGSGIVWDSDCDQEYEEWRIKARVLNPSSSF
jgi:para-aminobenzoate synthetase/4-amino-4-deoxychorismate lyase